MGVPLPHHQQQALAAAHLAQQQHAMAMAQQQQQNPAINNNGAPSEEAQTNGDARPSAEKKPQETPARIQEAVHKFIGDHPQYMRVLKDPKLLQDARIKTVLQKDLKNAPLVRTFLEAKGLKI